MRRGVLAGALVACALAGAGAAAVASLLGDTGRPPVAFWMRDDDDSRLWDRPGGQVIGRVLFTPHRFDDESGAATLLPRVGWAGDLLARAGVLPDPAGAWTADYLSSVTATGARWHRFARTSDLDPDLAPAASLAGAWAIEDWFHAGTWTVELDVSGRASVAGTPAPGPRWERGRWGARDGVIQVVWSPPPGDSAFPTAFPLVGVVADDGLAIRGIAGTRWRAWRNGETEPRR